MTFTKERIIEELKASTQNASGMFEISEDTICALMELLESRADAEPVAWEVKGVLCHTLEEASRYVGEPEPLYTRPQPAPVVPDAEPVANPLLDFARDYIESWELGMAGDSELLASAKKAIADSSPQQPAPVVPNECTDKQAVCWMHSMSMSGNYRDGWNDCRAAMLQGKAEPVSQPYTLSEWIPCGERMPPSRHAVLVGCWWGREWASKWATYIPGHPDAQESGWLIPGASWNPTHWMPLPAAPRQEKE